MVSPRTLSTLSQLNDLRHAALDALKAKHKYPALLLLYSFIDICASVSDEFNEKSNKVRFEKFLNKYANQNWEKFSVLDLWAARSSLIHTFSPLGNYTKPEKGAKPIFYFAWPETEEEVHTAILVRGYRNFILLDVNTIKFIAIDCFNAMWKRVETEPLFEKRLMLNSKHLLKDLFQMRLEDELVLIDEQTSYP